MSWSSRQEVTNVGLGGSLTFPWFVVVVQTVLSDDVLRFDLLCNAHDSFTHLT